MFVVTSRTWSLASRWSRVDTLGHAWSGGDDQHPYNDPHAPDATALLGTFIHEAVG